MKPMLRVLIAEDTESDAALIVRELERGGYRLEYERVETAAALKSALSKPWDILLSDFSMPSFTAPDALRILQESGLDLPFVIVSGTVGEERAVEAMRAGAGDYVLKANMARLVAVVERELREAVERRKRRQAEQAVRASEVRLNETQRLARLGGWDLDLLKNDLKWSDEIYRIFEIEPTQFGTLYEAFLDTVHPDDRDLVNRTYTESVQNRIPYDIVHRLRMKDGRVKYVHERCETFYDEQGRPLRSHGTVQDITERKQAEETLFHEKERAQVTLQSIGDAVITTDAEGLITYLNPIAEEITGWDSAEAQGRPLLQVFNAMHETTRQPVECPATVCLREQRNVALSQHTVLVRRDGVEFAIEDSAAPIRDRSGNIIGAVLVFHDVSHARVLANQIAYQAHHDSLTGLINRHEFEDCINQALESAATDGRHHAMCYIDLDQFKIVNDCCGHIAGDQLLKELAGILHSLVRENDVLARLGGDEFGVLLEGCPLDKAFSIAEALRDAIGKFRFAWGDRLFEIGASIGLVAITSDSGSLTDVLSAADSACYAAKDRGRNRVHVYRANDTALLQRRGEMRWVGRIHKALEEDNFCLYYQTMLPLNPAAASGVHYELLLRMKDPEDGLTLPSAFLPAAERYSLMPTLDRWVIRRALSWLSRNGSGNDLATCAINLSGQSLCDDRFLNFVVDELSQAGVRASQLCFEITETAAIANLSRAMRFISTLKGMGCRFALDDFGSGLSSFTYLKNLPVDYLKIDGTFIKDMMSDPIDHAMVESINQIGHVMRIQTIAEWVESEAILLELKKIGVDYAQGYAISPPLPWESPLLVNPGQMKILA
jgi:diguanylate cyclase (GGDEF)-like protein/PAS domain S-box-containing protein